MRAEEEDEDLDVRFILLWIGFNASYAGDLDQALAHDQKAQQAGNERKRFQEFFGALHGMDGRHRIYDLIWNRFPHEIRLLLDNPYVYSPFWQSQRKIPGYENWKTFFDREKRAINKALKKQDTKTLLSIMFDRLYVLRNQLVHGGATWKSSVNRDQVRDGAELLGSLLPVFIDIMMDNPDHEWTMPHYPVHDE